MDRIYEGGEQIQQPLLDPVCGMRVSVEAAERNKLYREYGGVKYVFCSLACSQVFQLNPQHFVSAQGERAQTGNCELCSKVMREGDEVSTLAIRGSNYQFCCPTCASVYSNSISAAAAQAEPKQASQPPGSPVERLRNSGALQWLEEAVYSHASDLFLSVGERPTLKIYGVFKRIGKSPLGATQLSEIIRTFMPKEKQAQFLAGREVDMGLDVAGCSRFRINVFRQQNGEAVAIRPIPYKIPTLDELNLPSVFNDFTYLKRGLILITGPTGSGKSTTLAALIDTINRQEERHIITIEDPIEYVIPNQRSLVHQREVGLHTRSFSDGLRNALRENPDIIVVGELRDLESISLAIRAAETGSLVLGTLHSGTAIQAVTRLLDVFDTERQLQVRIQLGQSLQAICAQRLVNRADRQGMTVVTEVLIATPAIRSIIRQNRLQELPTYMQAGGRYRMHTLQQNINDLFNKGVVDIDAFDQIEKNSY